MLARVIAIAVACLVTFSAASEGRAQTIAFVGDSMADGIWGAVVRMSAGQACRADFELLREAHNGSGLARPDAFNWKERIARIVNEEAPQVIVASLGLNDHQAIPGPDGRIRPGDPAWSVAYANETRAFFTAATSGGATVLMIGVPVLRDAQSNQHALLLNQIYEQVADEPGQRDVHYVDPWHLSDPDEFVSFGPGPQGNVVQLRASDGIHFTQTGYDLIGLYLRETLLDALRDEGYRDTDACLGM